VSTQRASVATSRPHPMTDRRDSFAERQIIPGPRAPKTAPLRISVFIRFAMISHSVRIQFSIIRFAFGSVSIRVPRFAQQGHDLAVAILPCQVEGRLAAKVLKRQIGAAFEKSLDDREAAPGCRLMQS